MKDVHIFTPVIMKDLNNVSNLLQYVYFSGRVTDLVQSRGVYTQRRGLKEGRHRRGEGWVSDGRGEDQLTPTQTERVD